ncbi:hypothetical protein SARC_04004 [Sphaeroforma arctica JP610]|uniref:Uncharacterized protein n=1 Tax=Sphaeroforma arctica JP610 TaxID=667725 RepID=A0A0L0G4D8_9EUKA|nr:hypothetical protein SARC_04004 [Sphaeroforma arctica JP610]KNC83754.1 hypothetical protein SARC_04004 [Sphaeroforma arctica JP610]|eukprot:XP_014157656.1 hypothetical protein SARC_04004 [Sphaeroforma arctica JP610]
MNGESNCGMDEDGNVIEMDTSGVETRNAGCATGFAQRHNGGLNKRLDMNATSTDGGTENIQTINQHFATEFLDASRIAYFEGKAAEFQRRAPREKQLKRWEWCAYLINALDGRYEKHPTFKFSMQNIKARQHGRPRYP